MHGQFYRIIRRPNECFRTMIGSTISIFHHFVFLRIRDGAALMRIFLSVSENVREFTCGKLYYRTFHLDEERDALYVGAM